MVNPGEKVAGSVGQSVTRYAALHFPNLTKFPCTRQVMEVGRRIEVTSDDDTYHIEARDM